MGGGARGLAMLYHDRSWSHLKRRFDILITFETISCWQPSINVQGDFVQNPCVSKSYCDLPVPLR